MMFADIVQRLVNNKTDRTGLSLPFAASNTRVPFRRRLAPRSVWFVEAFSAKEGDGLIEYKGFLRWLSNPDAVQ